jgi:2-oxoglutarate dehydrogenase E1 component
MPPRIRLSPRKVAECGALHSSDPSLRALAVQIDPLGTPPPGAQELTLEFHGLTEADLDL